MELVENETWQNEAMGDGSWSGKLANLRKAFYLCIVAESVRLAR